MVNAERNELQKLPFDSRKASVAAFLIEALVHIAYYFFGRGMVHRILQNTV